MPNFMLKSKFLFMSLICLSVHGNELEVTYRCKFSDGQSTDFGAGNPISKKSEFPELIFDKVNLSKRTARLIGNNGAVDIQLLAGSDSLHLVEQTPTGNLSIATIFTNVNYVKLNSYPVVISRHMSMSSSPMVSQYRGFCRIMN